MRLRRCGHGLRPGYKFVSFVFTSNIGYQYFELYLGKVFYCVHNMAYKFRDQYTYLDPHWRDRTVPVPRWMPDSQRPWKTGQPRGAFIWPRDKGQTNTPPRSWRRLKDIFLGKGPGIWIGDRRSYGPHRPTWTNWLEHDNAGYRNAYDQAAVLGNKKLGTKRYDFKTRTYRAPRHDTWSDAKWERRRHPKEPLYYRNRDGEEIYDLGFNSNPFAYSPYTPWFDWGRPSNNNYYYNHYISDEF